MSFIELKNIGYRYPGAADDALKKIDLLIEKGEMVLLMGPSGSGKSTLGKLLAGSVPNFYGGRLNGEAKYEGEFLKDMDRRTRAGKITMVFQDPERQLFMNKVHREIAQGLESIAADSRNITRRVWEAMEFTGISPLAYRDISTLSGGEKQKVSIASALAYQPECIIFDEPTSQLDPTAAEEIFSLLCRINDELGIAIIMIEQRVDWRLHNIDRILFMEKGSIVFNGNIHDFFFTGREEYLTPVLKMARYLRLNTFPKSLKDIRRAARDAAPKVRGRVEFESDTSQNSCIELQGIKVSLENNEILKGINLKIKSGEFVSVMGANGAGKTTLIKAICGLYKYEGSIKLGGSEVKKHKLKEIASKIGYVSQNPNDYISKETVYDEIKFTLENFNITDENRIARVMDKLHLTELKDRNPRDLSGGEKQRTAIASVMVMLPEILILDEPTRGMDLVLKNELGLLLKEMNAEGKTIILVTHDMDFAAEFCTRHVLMFSGKIAAEGTIKEVMGDNLYYTTGINKIFRDINSDVFTLKQLERE